MTTENTTNQTVEVQDNLDIGSVLASATDEQLEQVDTFEEFITFSLTMYGSQNKFAIVAVR